MMGYIDTYFRVKTVNYHHGNGWSTQDEKEAFERESCSVFKSMGWNIVQCKYSGHCDKVHRGKEMIHLHPMFFSGVILEESIPEIEMALSTTKTFQWYHTDTYARYFEMSDSEYLRYLSNKREEMVQDILQEYQTKRRNLFITSDEVLQKIQKKYHLCRVGENNSSDVILSGVLDNLFSMLLARGNLLQSPTRYGIGYRTATEKDKKEQKTA